MKKIILGLLIVFTLACKNDKKSISVIESQVEWDKFVDKLNEKATAKGGYANINYREKSDQTEFIVDITTDTNKTSWEQYDYVDGSFKFVKDVKLEIIGDAKPTYFVYKPYQYDMKKISKLVSVAKEKLAKEKGVQESRAVLYALNSPNFTNNNFEKEFNNVIWCQDLKTKTYYTFRFNAADSCEMFTQLPPTFKF